jgi:hypothetical protein
MVLLKDTFTTMSKEKIQQAITNGDPIRSLCWKEPFGSLMLPPYNKVETRTWKTNVRGLVLIVLSQPYNPAQIVELCGLNQGALITRTLTGHDGFMKSCAIGIGRLADCRHLREDDKHFLEWTPSLGERYAHIYEDVYRIETIPMKGHQGWRFVPDEIRKQIKLI